MTVIAFDGKTLAADKRSTMEDGAIGVTTKIHRIGPDLVGHSGNAAVGRALLHWFRCGAVADKFPDEAKDDKANLIVIRPDGGIELYSVGPVPTRFEMPAMAWGCGRDFAMAAMRLGKTAEEAVALTCELNAFCGNGVDALALEPQCST